MKDLVKPTTHISVRARLQAMLASFQVRSHEDRVTDALRERVRHMPSGQVSELIDNLKPEELGLNQYQFFEARRAVLAYCEID